jgi:hypothetical protein
MIFSLYINTMGRFREYAELRLAEEVSIKDLINMIVTALGGSPENDNYRAKISSAADTWGTDNILDTLSADPGVGPILKSNPAALTALQNDSDLTIGQLAGMLANPQQ